MAELVYDIDLNVRQALKGLTDLKKKVDKTNKAVKQSNKVFSKFKGILTTTALVGFGMFIKKSLDASDALGKVANKTGFSIDALQELRHAAELAGMSTLQLDTSLQRFSRRVGEAGNGTGVLAKDLEALGIKFKNQDGSMRNINAVFMDYMGAISGSANEQEKLRLAVAAFDMEGAQMVNMLQDGVSGLSAMRAEAEDLGIVLDKNTVESATRAKDAWTKVSSQFSAIGQILAAELAPVIKSISDDLSTMLKNKEAILAMRDAFKSLGDAVRFVWENMSALATTFKTFVVAWAALGIMKKTAQFTVLIKAFGEFTGAIAGAKLMLSSFGKIVIRFVGAWGLVAAAIWGAYEVLKMFIGASDELDEKQSGLDAVTRKATNTVKDRLLSVMTEAEVLEKINKLVEFRKILEGDLTLNAGASQKEATLKQIANIDKQISILRNRDTTLNVGTGNVSGLIELKKAIEGIEETMDPSVALWREYNKQVAIVVKALDKGVINKAKATEFVQYLQEEFEASLNALEGFGDEVEEQVEQSKTWAESWKDAFKEYQEAAFDAANNAKTIFNSVTQNMEDAIFNFAKTGKMNFKSFAQSVIDDMLRIQSKKLAANIMGGASSAGSSLGNLFAGYFAGGGVIPNGRYGVVGEAGPELVEGPANVSKGSASNVTYNINAVDAPSFQALLASDPEFLFALTEQGRETLPSFA